MNEHILFTETQRTVYTTAEAQLSLDCMWVLFDTSNWLTTSQARKMSVSPIRSNFSFSPLLWVGEGSRCMLTSTRLRI